MSALERVRADAVARPWGGTGLPQYGLLPPASSAQGATFGEYWVAEPRFPLLVKVIEARERLSIQVHPDDATARDLGEPSGKTEAWVVLEAQPGAELWLGLAGHDPDPRPFFARARRGEDVSSDLVRFTPQAGDAYFVPAGTLHAIGGGLILLEVQQPADVTYRVYDWDRKPARALHLDQAEAAFRRDPRARRIPNRGEAGAGRVPLLECEHFALERVQVAPGSSVEVAPSGRVELWFASQGQGRVEAAGERVQVSKGAFFLAQRGAGPLCLEAARDRAPFELLRMIPPPTTGGPDRQVGQASP